MVLRACSTVCVCVMLIGFNGSVETSKRCRRDGVVVQICEAGQARLDKAWIQRVMP